MTYFPLCCCSDLETRQIKWISENENDLQGSFPGSFIHWGVPAYIIAAQCAEVRADEVAPCPISGWHPTFRGVPDQRYSPEW